MVIEKLRQRAKLEAEQQRAATDARTARHAGRAKRRRASKSLVPTAIVRNRLFITILAAWGAAVAGMSVMALSSVTIARLSMFTGLGALGSLAQLVFACIAAFLGGAAALAFARMFRSLALRTSKRGPIATMAARRVYPIDPASDLGSESLDAPLERMPFSRAPEGEDDALDRDEWTTAPDAGSFENDDAIETSHEVEVWGHFDAAPEDGLDETLDLGAFDEITAMPEPAGNRPAAPEAPARSGVEKLRQSRPDELSLVQLVERFAAALHDAQHGQPRAMGGGTVAGDSRQSELALAEALKALALFTQSGVAQPGGSAGGQSAGGQMPSRFGARFSGQAARGQAGSAQAAAINDTENELREALAKLQALRGAA